MRVIGYPETDFYEIARWKVLSYILSFALVTNLPDLVAFAFYCVILGKKKGCQVCPINEGGGGGGGGVSFNNGGDPDVRILPTVSGSMEMVSRLEDNINRQREMAAIFRGNIYSAPAFTLICARFAFIPLALKTHMILTTLDVVIPMAINVVPMGEFTRMLLTVTFLGAFKSLAPIVTVALNFKTFREIVFMLLMM